MSLSRIVIVVLGDVGRSPRMQYHAQSCLELGWTVDVIGYAGSRPIAALLDAEKRGKLRFHYLTAPSDLGGRGGAAFIVSATFRAARQFVSLLYILLFRCGQAEWILCQIPPSIPTLAVVHFSRWANRRNLLLDWHNTSTSMLALKRGPNTAVVKIAEFYEKTLARLEAKHLAVSQALRQMLIDCWGVRRPIHILYDRPQDGFRRLSSQEADAFFARMGFAPPAEGARRRARIVSSTSWTPDEDFDLLLRALKKYDAMTLGDLSLPDLEVWISGKGPLLDPFIEKLAAVALRHSTVRTFWLEPEDYPRLLGACDLGLSLHRSSSGLDLPMKIADMFGCGLPVIALGYPALRRELITDGKNGWIVENAEDLAATLGHLLQNETLLDGVRRQVLREYGTGEKRWKQEWETVVAPILND